MFQELSVLSWIDEAELLLYVARLDQSHHHPLIVLVLTGGGGGDILDGRGDGLVLALMGVPGLARVEQVEELPLEKRVVTAIGHWL